MCQRLGLAQVLLGDPELLILDEPMSGLDPPGRKMVRDLLVEQREAGKTVVFSTHILSDAEAVCTRAGILRDGQLSRELEIDEMARLNSGAVEVRVQGLHAEHVTTLTRRGLSCTTNGAVVQISVSGAARTQELLRTLTEWGVAILAVAPRHALLEEIYMATQQSKIADVADASPLAADTTQLGEVR
jgi:ABC-2 type transport system ATP-binding protein